MKKILLVLVSFMMFSAFAEPMFKWSNELGFSPINLEKEDSGKNVGNLIKDSIYDEFKLEGGVGRFYTDNKYRIYINNYYSETFLGWVCNDIFDLQCFIVAGAVYDDSVNWKDTHYESYNPSVDFKIGRYNEINVGVNFDFYGGEYSKTTFPIYWKIHN